MGFDTSNYLSQLLKTRDMDDIVALYGTSVERMKSLDHKGLLEPSSIYPDEEGKLYVHMIDLEGYPLEDIVTMALDDASKRAKNDYIEMLKLSRGYHHEPGTYDFLSHEERYDSEFRRGGLVLLDRSIERYNRYEGPECGHYIDIPLDGLPLENIGYILFFDCSDDENSCIYGMDRLGNYIIRHFISSE